MKRLKAIFTHHLLRGFIPWVVFYVAIGFPPHSTLLAGAFALILMLLCNFKEIRLGFILPWGSMLAFAIIALNGMVGFWEWANRHPSPIANTALALIFFVSILMGKPFTMQYARQNVDPSLWDSPSFLRINWTLTSIWTLLITILAMPGYFLTPEEVKGFWLYRYGLTAICVGTGWLCTLILPRVLRNR